MKRNCRTILLLAGAAWALAGCGGSKTTVRQDAESYYGAGTRELEERNCLKAAELFKKVVVNFPGSHLVDDAQYGIAEAKFCSHDYTEAIWEYGRLIDEYPNSPFSALSRYKIGASYSAQSHGIHRDQTDTVKGIAEYQRFIEDYPDHELVPEAKRRLGELKGRLAAKDLETAENYLRWGYPESAQVYFEEVLNAYGDTPLAGDARLGLALVKARNGKVKEAIGELEGLLSEGATDSLKKKAKERLEQLRKQLEENRKGSESESGATDRHPGGGFRSDP